MNTEDFVTFEQALALKKLGFCEEAIGKYVDCPNDPTLFNGMLYQSWNLEKDEILAPTLAQAQKWLRKEEIYLIYEIGLGNEIHNAKFGYSAYNYKGYIVSNLSSGFIYDTPEEALSAGINECLKLLENE